MQNMPVAFNWAFSVLSMSDATTSHERIQDAEPKPSPGSGGWLADAAALFGAGVGVDEEKSGALHAVSDRQIAEQSLIRPWIERNALWIPEANLKALQLGGTEYGATHGRTHSCDSCSSLNPS